MRKVPVGYGYSNQHFELSDFVCTATRPLIIDQSGRRWRGKIHLVDEQLGIVLKDGREVLISLSEISFVGDPIRP